ncbi:MAG TPA: hypothetical protein VFY93_13815 [Planctomycetota bacterium]|nr:hypothetical protein [Planctomycetota bacterium]
MDVPIPQPREAALPRRVLSLITEAERRVASILERRTPPGFVCSEFQRVGLAIQGIADANLATGTACCEWGSGLGVVALMAACQGFNACGIEIDADLVDAATVFAADLGLDVEFVCGTFVPPGGEDLTDVPQEFGWLSAAGACGHELLGVDPDEFDLVFAYPWPGEEEVLENLFERFAGDSALLLTFNGLEDLQLRRKVAGAVGT